MASGTQFPFSFQVDPVLEDHFELLVNEVEGESVPARTPLHDIVLVGGELFHCSVESYAVPD